jgi:nucleotide-binding universal stress UspA family protein
MKKILVAIDCTPSAYKVAEQAYSLGKAMNAEIVLLHVVEDVGYYMSPIYDPIMGLGTTVSTNIVSSDTLQNTDKGAIHFLEKIKSHLQNEGLRIIILHGNIVENILEFAKQEHVDIIVIGTHSRSIIEELFLGSTAHKLIKQESFPIFVIPTKKVIGEN